MDKNPNSFAINSTLIINNSTELNPHLGNKRQRLNDDLTMLNNTNDYMPNSTNMNNNNKQNLNEIYKIKQKKQKTSPTTSTSDFNQNQINNTQNNSNQIPLHATSFHFEYPQHLDPHNNQLHQVQYNQPNSHHHMHQMHHMGPLLNFNEEDDEEEDDEDDYDEDEDEEEDDNEDEDDEDEDDFDTETNGKQAKLKKSKSLKQKRTKKSKEAEQNDLDKKAAEKLNKSMLKSRSKKTKGRVKIKMEFIENKIRRYTTFSKRKTGIMKKAYELSTLTGTQVMLLVASETGHVYTFATDKLQPMITSETGKTLIQSCLSYNQDINENESNIGSGLAGTSGEIVSNDNGKNKISIEFNSDEFQQDLLDDEDDEIENYEDDEPEDDFNCNNDFKPKM